MQRSGGVNARAIVRASHRPSGHEREIGHRKPENLGTRQPTVEQQSLGEPHSQGVEHGQVEDRRHLVDRRLAQRVLVAVVKTDCLAYEHDERCQQRDAGPYMDRCTIDDEDRDQEREVGRDHVGERKCSTEKRIAPGRNRVAGGFRHPVDAAYHVPDGRNLSIGPECGEGPCKAIAPEPASP